PSGIYTLSIPTGGGKTLASLRYALKHAKTHNKKRIIYVVPFTTIIEQNAEEVRRILEDEENILEHHSNIVEEVNEHDENEDGMVSIQ
ncbi:DEAD/DEAH box helicase family protein, partial [Bacillus wiedmannii]